MGEVILFAISCFLIGFLIGLCLITAFLEKASEEIDDSLLGIDDNYYEAFTLVQKELEKVMEEHRENDTYKAIPAQRIYEVICATDMFRNQIYKRYEGADRKELDDTASES